MEVTAAPTTATAITDTTRPSRTAGSIRGSSVISTATARKRSHAAPMILKTTTMRRRVPSIGTISGSVPVFESAMETAVTLPATLIPVEGV
jgi:hypothetical protein